MPVGWFSSPSSHGCPVDLTTSASREVSVGGGMTRRSSLKETNLTKNHSYLMWGGSTLGPVLVLLVVIVVPYPYPSMSFCFKGIWHSVHIDDLRDMEDMSLNLSEFSATPISKLLHPQASGTNTAASAPLPLASLLHPEPSGIKCTMLNYYLTYYWCLYLSVKNLLEFAYIFM